jgi:hypothetical protein
VGRLVNLESLTILQFVADVVAVDRADMVYDLFLSGSHLVCCSLLAIIKNVIAKGSA